MSDTRKIELTRGMSAIVDAGDYELLARFKWHAAPCGRATAYAFTRTGKKKTSMHRMLISPSGAEVDHVNGNGLDNRRCNLRSASRTENGRNCKKMAGASSRFKGVYWNSQVRKWRAGIIVERKYVNLGLFPVDQEEDAARVWDAAALARDGEFARLNFPKVAA